MTKLELITHFINTDFKENLLECGMPLYEVSHMVNSHIERFRHSKRIHISDAFFKWVACTEQFPELIEMFSSDNEDLEVQR